MKCELVILKIIDLYQYSVNVQHTTGSCAGSIAYITCRHTNADEHSSADGKTGGWTRITENKVKCFHCTTASLQRTSISNTGTLSCDADSEWVHDDAFYLFHLCFDGPVG